MTDPLPPRPKKNDPDFKEKMRAYWRDYYARPENRARRKEYARVYYDKNKERLKEWTRVYSAKNKERICAYYARPEVKERIRVYHASPRMKARKRAYSARPENRARERAHSYNLTTQKVDVMLAAQNGLCLICKKPPRGKKGNDCLQIDHCHKTGKVRAMLCGKCNKGLGFANDDPTLLRKMADYIESYQ